MPQHLPDDRPNKKPGVKVAAARDSRIDPAAQKPRIRSTADKSHAVEKIDWLAQWSLSIAFSALVMAGLAYFSEGDTVGASVILAGAAGIVALVLLFSEAPSEG